MIWLLSIILALVCGYSVLCLIIGRDRKSGGDLPYWLLLITSIAILSAAWFHPIRITFA